MDGEPFIAVDSETELGDGAARDSVRIVSSAHYNHGLFIARFSHLPRSACGLWPAL